MLPTPAPRHSLVHEKYVLGVLLVDRDVIHEESGVLSENLFYDAENRRVWQVMESLYKEGNSINMLTVYQKSKSLGIEVSATYLSMLAGATLTAKEFSDAVHYLHDLYLSRELIVIGGQLCAAASDETNDVTDIITETFKRLEGLLSGVNAASSRAIGEAVREEVEAYFRRKQGEDKAETITTGLSDLNKILCGGWRGGQMIVLAGRPGMGKTSMALHFSLSAACAGNDVLFLSLEMTAAEIAQKFLLCKQQFSTRLFREGCLDKEQEEGLITAVRFYDGVAIRMVSDVNVSVQRLAAIAQAEKAKGRCRLLVIDYLQLLNVETSSSNRTYTKEAKVADVSRALKILSVNLAIPVIVLSQLNRESTKRPDKLPDLADLRDSGAIEQDADAVLFVHRAEYYDRQAPKGIGDVIIAKQRNGRTGKVKFKYSENLCRMSDVGPLEIPL